MFNFNFTRACRSGGFSINPALLLETLLEFVTDFLGSRLGPAFNLGTAAASLLAGRQ
jgi:hypothetical protein